MPSSKLLRPPLHTSCIRQRAAYVSLIIIVVFITLLMLHGGAGGPGTFPSLPFSFQYHTAEITTVENTTTTPEPTEAPPTPVPTPAPPPPCLRRKRGSARFEPPLANMTLFNEHRLRTDTCHEIDPTGGYGWKFVRYEPSALERRWKIEEAPVDRVFPGMCNLWIRDYTNVAQLLDRTTRAHAKNMTATMAASCTQGGADVAPNSSLLPTEHDFSVFSRFVYEYGCIRSPCTAMKPEGLPELGTVRYSYIEPLVGPLRHTLFCHDAGTLVDKTYLMMDRWHVIRSHDVARRNFYFDVGATTYIGGDGDTCQRWFDDRFTELCAKFTDYYAWEADHVDPKKVIREVPGAARPHYHWFNVPCNPAASSWDNPNNYVLNEATVEDFVVYKIDFDQPALEDVLIKQILNTPELSELIDELYFEYHVNQDKIRNYWAAAGMPIYHQDSLRMFTSLRELGIRAHSWV